MKGVQHNRMAQYKSSQGFTLLEVIIVMVIVGILATGVVFMFNNPSAKVKGQAFTILGDLNMARSEAVNRNVDVRVTFVPGAAAADQDGYRVWIDDWHAGSGAPGSDNIYTDGSDTLIRDVLFPREVQFYDLNATEGPDKKPFSPWPALDMEDLSTDDDGIEFDADDWFVFTSRGVAENSAASALVNTGYVLIYFPASATDHVTMRAAPYALVVSPGTGRVWISRWDKGIADWSRK